MLGNKNIEGGTQLRKVVLDATFTWWLSSCKNQHNQKW